MMRVTVGFNVKMTFACIGYVFALMPSMKANSPENMAEFLFPDSEWIQLGVVLVSLVAAVAIWMYVLRGLWNRLFPALCGWKEINLAEAYALTLFGFFFVYTGP